VRARLYVQDPTETTTSYLSEVLIEQIRQGDAKRLEVVMAFATADGLRAITEDYDFKSFADEGEVHIIVGIDAITLPEALDVLADATSAFPSFRAHVFENATGRLFHPKLVRITYDDGATTLIVGSGNATTGGLQGNFEAFTILDLDADEADLASDLDEFLERHAADLRELDERAYELAERNRRLIQRRQDAADVEPDEEDETAEQEVEPATEASSVTGAPVLVAQVPQASGRWGQVGLNEAVVDQFFRVVPNSAQRLRLRHVLSSGDVGGTEIRAIRMSETNRNRRLEIGAARGRSYPRRDTPILVFLERGARQYDYMLVFPGEPGHRELRRVLNTYASLGRGDPRAPITSEELAAEWSDSPLLQVE
jgi:hypothetical protein